jgi:hypothetical protein
MLTLSLEEGSARAVAGAIVCATAQWQTIDAPVCGEWRAI